jgi:hypothetical protein
LRETASGLKSPPFRDSHGQRIAKRRPGITTVVLALVIVVVIVVAGVGAYVLVSAPAGAAASTTSTLTIGTNTTTASSTSLSVTTSTPSQSSTQGYENYKGTFVFANPLGPFGINDSSGKPVEWNSTQSASGSFTFSVNPTTYLGTGTGQGSMTVTTRGYCVGTVTVPYTFTITAAHPPGENYIISFNTPTPSNATVQLSCQGSINGFNTANNPIAFLSVYPNGLSEATLPATVMQQPTEGISYTITITASS